MTEDRLRRWVLGQLPPDERREVSRWVVRCTDPDLAPLLAGMLREDAENRADDALGALGRAWRSLVEQWRALLDAGEAGWSGGLSPTLASAGDPTPVVRVTTVGTRVTVEVSDTALEVAVYLTDDAGRCDRLIPPGPVVAAGASEFVVSVGARPTVWAFTAPALPRVSDPVDELNEVLRASDATRSAVRWDPAEG